MVSYLIEAAVVGLSVAVVGLAVNATVMWIQNNLDVHDRWDWAWMSLGLFITGFLVHVLAQLTGANAWYCEHGDACAGRVSRR